MTAKLRRLRSRRVFQISPPPRGLLGRGVPHVLYANVEFGAASSRKDIDRLLSWLDPLSGWSSKRVLHYLEAHQAEFRRCMEWLANGSDIQLTEPTDEEKEQDEFWKVALSKKWQLQPEVRFLQEHGLDHGGVRLSPIYQTGSFFNGLELEQRKPRDPVDPICWYVLSLLMWEGSVSMCRCEYPKCHKFIYRPTSRKRFCDDNCRAKNAADKKTPEKKRKYMREYRALPKVKKREPKSRRRRTTA